MKLKCICPGQDDRDIKAKIIACPDCGYKVEIFSDEIHVKCPKCKGLVFNEILPSCVDWCKYAKECVGKQFYDNYMRDKVITMSQKLIKELEEYFGGDTKRINHAKKVMRFAEELLKKEMADWHIVIPASILHDIGIKIAEAKHNLEAGKHHEIEGPEIARKILLKFGYKKEYIDEICQIIAYHHTPGKDDTQNFKVLYDADWLVNLKDEAVTKSKTKLREMINKVFLTDAGKNIAKKIYLGKNGI